MHRQFIVSRYTFTVVISRCLLPLYRFSSELPYSFLTMDFLLPRSVMDPFSSGNVNLLVASFFHESLPPKNPHRTT